MLTYTIRPPASSRQLRRVTLRTLPETLTLFGGFGLQERIAVNKRHWPERQAAGGRQDGGLFFGVAVAMGVFAWQIHSQDSPANNTKRTPWWKNSEYTDDVRPRAPRSASRGVRQGS